jgi:glutamate carboxypeptidase
MELTAANRALADEARAALEAMGLGLGEAVVGGGSDGNLTSALGVATLDGLGAVGAGPHARHEHVRVAPTLERVALLAALVHGAV